MLPPSGAGRPAASLLSPATVPQRAFGGSHPPCICPSILLSSFLFSVRAPGGGDRRRRGHCRGERRRQVDALPYDPRLREPGRVRAASTVPREATGSRLWRSAEVMSERGRRLSVLRRGSLTVGETVRPMCVEQMRDSLDNDKTVFETIAESACALWRCRAASGVPSSALRQLCADSAVPLPLPASRPAASDEVVINGRGINARSYLTWYDFTRHVLFSVLPALLVLEPEHTRLASCHVACH